MLDCIEQRAVDLASYIADSHDTVRGAAKKFGVSKSTVHKDLTQRLRFVSPTLFTEVKAILAQHKDERHLRGGEATREKYRAMKK